MVSTFLTLLKYLNQMSTKHQKLPQSDPQSKQFLGEPQENKESIIQKIKNLTATQITFGVILMILLGSGGYYFYPRPVYSFVPAQTVQFQFQVFCPYYYQIFKKEPKINQDLRALYQTDSISQSDKDLLLRTYLVQVRYLPKNKNASEDGKLYYCGRARTYDGSCNDSRSICTSPGPIFDVNVSETINVVWKNSLDQDFDNYKTFNIFSAFCYSNNNGSHCKLDAKNFSSETFTFNDLHDKNRNIYDASPFNKSGDLAISSHLHGAQIRPAFDGNPLSWVSSQGEQGVGTFSATDRNYFKYFNNPPEDLRPLWKYIEFLYDNTTKVNVYKNTQNPGILWYHDHTMRATWPNVASGLSGMYIIRSPQNDKKLPSKDNEKFIMLTYSLKGNKTVHKSNEKNTFNPGETYRFRIVNNNFFANYHIKFVKGSDCSTASNIIPSRIIGADASLFENIPSELKSFDKQFLISSSQRLQVLIEFNQHSTICNGKDAIFKIKVNNNPKKQCLPENVYRNDVKCSYHYFNSSDAKFTDLSSKYSKLLDIQNKTKNSSEQNSVVKHRMRMLTHWNDKMIINGHYDFHKGSSQNPKIGTTQDIYFINSVYDRQLHPMHIHLILFQIIKRFKLKYIDTGFHTGDSDFPTIQCGLYQLDVVFDILPKTLLAGVFDREKQQDYQKLCLFLYGKNVTIDNQNYNISNQKIWNNFNDAALKFNLEDEFNSKNISGKNLFTLKNESKIPQSLQCQGCEVNISSKYAFICDQQFGLDATPWYKQWKDTAAVMRFEALVFRTRWTRSDYNQNDSNPGPYFNVPQDQLMEFPGFIYHCHILPHEDDEMMRSIMLQPSDKFQTNGTLCPTNKWEEKACCINGQGTCKK